MSKLSILLLEDNPIIAQRFQQIFEGWQKAGQIISCETLADAVETIQNHPVDLLVADLNLPDGSGVDAISLLSEQQPDAQAIVISALSYRSLVFRAIRAGAVGYLLKDDDSLEIIQACEGVLAGTSPMTASIARMMIDAVQEEETPAKIENPLTPREQEVLSAIARGYTYKEVAKLYEISASTVPVHIRNIYRKLQVNNRAQAAYEAKQQGFIEA
ncbi:MAG: response regulator transcription factor [Gammaproteobacteria bacterium]|jgi:DNA-binding NarL/FixJ family response regulator|nr:response regulator transcription factor [Gammaproteobacteria bacterium]MBT4606467.1 response regulator transcription factor [Thiotrichales bacterium]MBT3472875.1 response regulator transcription factor [Gammaproteobacteria bacterium]MBT3966634.1 response regulator transcription factor [Gammaproteobacteria bacterium]MBT4079438.1 response regulator transcription factor [Gammaproteobacteria bacterium]